MTKREREKLSVLREYFPLFHVAVKSIQFPFVPESRRNYSELKLLLNKNMELNLTECLFSCQLMPSKFYPFDLFLKILRKHICWSKIANLRT